MYVHRLSVSEKGVKYILKHTLTYAIHTPTIGKLAGIIWNRLCGAFLTVHCSVEEGIHHNYINTSPPKAYSED